MASTYSPSLRLELIGNGEQSGTWGTTTNTNLGTLIEQAITGVQTITMSNANYTLSSFNGASDEARNAVLVVTGTNSAIRNIIAPTQEKVYVIRNNTSGGYDIRIKTSASTGVLIPNGLTTIVYCDGSEFYYAIPTLSSTNTPNSIVLRDVSGDFAANIITASLNGNAATVTNGVYTTGDQTIGGVKTFSSNIVGNLTGNASTATNATSATSATTATKATNVAGGGAGQVPYNTGVDTTAFLAAGIAGQFLKSNGTSAPSWAAATTSADFTGSNQSLVSSGYQKLPGGLIIQWFTTSESSSQGSFSVNYPITFPNAFLVASCSTTNTGSSSNADLLIQFVSSTTSSITLYRQGVNNFAPIGAMVIAIGY